MKFPVWKGLKASLIIMIVMLMVVGVFFAVLAMVSDSRFLMFTTFCIGTILLCVIMYKRVLFCNVFVDSQGIYRVYKGKQITFFSWEDVYEIRVIIVRSGGRLPSNFPIIMIARRPIVYDDKKHIVSLINGCSSISIIAVQYTKEIDNEIRKYYTKSIETERFH